VGSGFCGCRRGTSGDFECGSNSEDEVLKNRM
jgi:hypothetical protein